MQSRLKEVKNGSTVIESYLYDPDGQRVKKTAGSTSTYYINQLYEVSGSTVTKYYFFNGQRIAMRKNGTLTYLHSDHLGSTVLETATSGAPTANQQYYAYGNQRDTGAVVTDHKFTGQKLDATGLQYYQSRYYDPAIGTFISPDTIVPDATNVFDYNRYMMARGNPLKYNDPTGHYSADEIIQHFGCDNWECVTAQFDGSNPDSSYVGNSAWLYVLINAVDGDKITAQNPDSNVTMTGKFLRNAESGKIGIQMLLADGTLTGAVPEQNFANYGAISRYAGGTRYALESSKFTPHIGQTYYLPGGCSVWDCTAIGFDSASILLSVAGDAAAGCTAISGPLCGSAMAYIKAADYTVTTAAAAYAASQYASGDASDLDIAIATADTVGGLIPGLGEGIGVGNLLWDLVDPAIPDERWWGPGGAK